MSIVAGFSMFGGVYLVADSRATVQRRHRADVHVDSIQKLFPLGSHSAIGFVGSIDNAGYVLGRLWSALRARRRRRMDAVTIRNWLPRFLRYCYGQIPAKHRKHFSVMVASAIPGRGNLIERARVAALLDRFRLGQLSHQRSWLPGVLVNILQTPPSAQFVLLTDAPRGLLYTLHAPQFEPQFFGPLSAIAIGSGEGAVSQFDLEADWIFAGGVNNPAMETMAVQNAVARYIHTHGPASVGGLFPCLRVSEGGVSGHGFSAEIPMGGERIELRPLASGRWEQIHHNSGTRVQSVFPWEFDANAATSSRKFDYLRHADNPFLEGRGCAPGRSDCEGHHGI